MSHTVTVTRIFDDPNADSEDAEYVIAGEHDNRCSVWYPCKVEGCLADDEGVFHGVDHAIVDGIDEPCTQGDGCGFTYAFEYDNPEFRMTELGTYDVAVDWDGDYWTATLSLRTSADTPTGSAS